LRKMWGRRRRRHHHHHIIIIRILFVFVVTWQPSVISTQTLHRQHGLSQM